MNYQKMHNFLHLLLSEKVLSKKAYRNLNMKEVYTFINPNSEIVVILNGGITTKMGTKWSSRSSRFPYKNGVSYSGPYLSSLTIC